MRAAARPVAAGLFAGAALAPLPPHSPAILFARPGDDLPSSPSGNSRLPPSDAELPALALAEKEAAGAAQALPPAAPPVAAVPTVPSVTSPEPPQPDSLAKAPAPPDLATAGPALPADFEPASDADALAAPPPLALTAASAPVPLVIPPSGPQAVARETETLRPVDIAQIAETALPGVRIPQLHEPGLAPGGPTLADKTAAMQIVLPPPARLSERELALLESDAPAELTVRIGDEAVGKVAFRMSESRTIDVQVSGLLDVLAHRFAPEEFARLRGAADADSYVPLDTLRSIGLSLRYDPVYDELRVSA